MSIEQWGQLKVNQGQLFKSAVSKLSAEIIRLNQEQLSEGKDAKGSRLPPYSTRHEWARIKKGLQISNKDLKFTGEFWDEFYTAAFEESFEIGSRDWKEGLLEKAWGEIFGFDEVRTEKFINLLRPILQDELREPYESAFNSIYECPIMNFQRAIETNDLRHLLRVYDKDYKEDLTPVFKKLNDEIIDEFGLTEVNQLIFYKTREITKLKAKRIINDDESCETSIQIAEMQLKRLREKTNIEGSIRQLHTRNHRILTKWSGWDTHTLTVFQYYSYLKDFDAEIEKDKNASKAK
jgi:hypothetical protein